MRIPVTHAVSAALVIVAAVAFSSTAHAAPSWTSPTVLGPTVRGIGTPNLAVTPDGEAIATWVGSEPKRILVSSRRPGKGWSPPVAIAPVTEEVEEGPELAVSAGKAVIVWMDNIRTRSGARGVVRAATRLRGKRWSRPRNISAEKRWYEEPEGREPQVTMTRGGKAIVVWQAHNEKHPTVSFIASATQAAGGTDWTAPVGIRGSYEGEAPQVATTPAGEVVAIWGAYYNEESNIAVSSRPRKGPWKGAWQLSTPGTFPQPQLGVTSKGEAIGTWTKELVEGGERKVQVTTRTPGGKWRVKTLDPQGYGTGPRILTEPGGRATVLWVKSAPLSFEEGTIVASTHAPGGGWSEPRSPAADGLQLSVLPIAVTRGGESVALWVADGPLGERTTILSSSSHRPQPWSEPQQVSVSSCGRLYGSSDLALALAPNGKAFAVWRCFNGNRWVIKSATRPTAGSGS
jgi:hypothetical protein